MYLCDCNVLAELFAEHYFGADSERWWVGEDIGGCFCVNDHFFSANDMADYVYYKYSKDDMFAHCQYRLERLGGTPKYNIKNWKKLK